MSSPLCERSCATFEKRRDVCDDNRCATVGYNCHQFGAPNTTTDCFQWCCVKDENMIAVVVIILVVVFLVVVGCIIFIFCFCCRKKKEKRRGTLNRENLVQKQLELEEEGNTDDSESRSGAPRDERPDSVSVILDRDDSQAISLSMAAPPGGNKNANRNAWGGTDGSNSLQSTPRQPAHPRAQQYEEETIPQLVVEKPPEDRSLNGSRQPIPVSARSNASQQPPPEKSPRGAKKKDNARSPNTQKLKRSESLFEVPDLTMSPGPYDLDHSSSGGSPQALDLEDRPPRQAPDTSVTPSTANLNNNNNNARNLNQVPPQQRIFAPSQPPPAVRATPSPRPVSPPHHDEVYFNDDQEDEEEGYGGNYGGGGGGGYSPQQAAAAPPTQSYGGHHQPEFDFGDDDDFFS